MQVALIKVLIQNIFHLSKDQVLHNFHFLKIQICLHFFYEKMFYPQFPNKKNCGNITCHHKITEKRYENNFFSGIFKSVNF